MNNFFEAHILFETNIAANGYNHLVIYGKHVNGYFCCIPDWNVGCEMAEPNDTYWNYQSLCKTGLNQSDAKIIVQEIKKIMKDLNGGAA